MTHVLATVPWLMRGDFSSYHRVLSQRRWSLWPLARVLAQAILAWIPSEEPVLVAMDEHATQHRGKQVFGKDKHRDAAVQSQPDRVALGAQVGGAGHLRATAVRLASLGPTGLVRSLPFAPTR